MRLPWPFRRRLASQPAAGLPEMAAVSPPPAAPHGEWSALVPPVQTLGEPPLIAPPRPFAGGLAVNNAPAPTLSALGHERSLSAPAGLVIGLSRRVAQGSQGAGSALPLRRSGSLQAAGAFVEAAHADAPAQRVAQATGAAPDAVAMGDLPALRRLPPAGPASQVSGRSLAGLTAADMARLPVAPPAGVMGPAAGSAEHVSANVPASGRTLPPSPQPPPAAAPAAAAGRAATPVAAAEPAAGSRLTLGQSRRAGLGAPLAELPLRATQRAQRFDPPEVADPIAMAVAASDRIQPHAEQARAGVGGSPATEPDLLSAGSPLPVSGVTTSAPALASALSRMPSLHPARAERGKLPQAASARAVSAERIVQRPRRSQAPLTSAQPLRTGIQRAPLAGAEVDERIPATPTPAAASGAADGPVLVHRGEEANQNAASLGARAFTHAGEIFLPANHGPLNSGRARSLLAHELVHVAQQRMLGSQLPAEDTPRGRQLEAQARAAEMGDSTPLILAAGPARSTAESAPQAGAMRAPQTGMPQAPSQETAIPPAVGETTVVGLSTVQRAADEPLPALPSPLAGRRTEQELEELARQLYGRIALRLRRDLLVQRERAGMAFDVR